MQGRPLDTQEHKEGEQELKKRHFQGLGIIGAIPYGQSDSKLTKANKAAVLKYWQSVEKSGLWGKTHLMSFEAWCAMTCFNDHESDGGPAFQKLMLCLIGHGQKDGISGIQEALKYDQMWNADDREYGKMFKDCLLYTSDAADE